MMQGTHRVSADTGSLYVFHHQHPIRASLLYPRGSEMWITAESLWASERAQAGHLPGIVAFVCQFFLHDMSHPHQSAPFAVDNDGEVQYSKRLIEEKTAREKPPRRQ